MWRSCSAALVSVALLINGCGGDSGSSGTCTPMFVQPCRCLDGTQGFQACVATGDAYSACDCTGGITPTSGSSAGQGGAGVSGTGALDGSIGPITLPDGAVVAADGGIPATGPGTVIAEPTDEAAFLWDDTQLRTFELTIAPADLAKIDANPEAEEYVPASFKMGDETLASVSVRYKGSVGAFITCTNPITGAKTCRKLSMKVAFDEPLPEQRFHGLKKLNFHAMAQDDSVMRDRLGYAMFREMGLAAPRCVHARLLINGDFAGLFTLVEEIDGRFTDAHFSAPGDGNLYKEIWPKWTDPSVYPPSLRTNRNDPSVSFDRVIRFAQGVEAAADDTAVMAFADQWMDPDYVMNYIAVDRTILNDDGIFHWYCNPDMAFTGYNPGACSNHNYFWYEEDRVDRLWLVAWDLTLAFEGQDSGVTRIVDPWNDTAASCGVKSNGAAFADDQIAPACDKLTHAWASRPEAYKAAIKRFLDGPFAAANVDAKLSAWQAQVMPVITEGAAIGHTPSGPAFTLGVNNLKNAIARLRSAAQTRAQ